MLHFFGGTSSFACVRLVSVRLPCLATALTASVFVLSRRLLGLRQFPALQRRHGSAWASLGTFQLHVKYMFLPAVRSVEEMFLSALLRCTDFPVVLSCSDTAGVSSSTPISLKSCCRQNLAQSLDLKKNVRCAREKQRALRITLRRRRRTLHACPKNPLKPPRTSTCRVPCSLGSLCTLSFGSGLSGVERSERSEWSEWRERGGASEVSGGSGGSEVEWSGVGWSGATWSWSGV